MELNDVLLEIKEFSLQPSKWNRRSTGKKLLTPLTFYFPLLSSSPPALRLESEASNERVGRSGRGNLMKNGQNVFIFIDQVPRPGRENLDVATATLRRHRRLAYCPGCFVDVCQTT